MALTDTRNDMAETHQDMNETAANAGPRPTQEPIKDRLEAIAAGQLLPSQIHPCMAEKDAIVQIKNFYLWYGSKQALYDISMVVPRGEVPALIGPASLGQSHQRSDRYPPHRRRHDPQRRFNLQHLRRCD